jgi:hypothetical protein
MPRCWTKKTTERAFPTHENSGRHVRPESFPEHENRSEAVAEAEKIRALSSFSTMFDRSSRSSWRPLDDPVFDLSMRLAAMQRSHVMRHHHECARVGNRVFPAFFSRAKKKSQAWLAVAELPSAKPGGGFAGWPGKIFL